MPNQQASKVERAFALYSEMNASERREYALLCRGFDVAQEPKKTKPAPAKDARPSRSSSTAPASE